MYASRSALSFTKNLKGSASANLNPPQQQLNASFAADERRRQAEREAYGKYDVAEARGDLLMGRTAVEDPDNQYGNPHYDYGHHKAHWKDKNDNWIDTNDLNYDPNADPDRNGQWIRVQERKVGE
jgi:hypothetical protein